MSFTRTQHSGPSNDIQDDSALQGSMLLLVAGRDEPSRYQTLWPVV